MKVKNLFVKIKFLAIFLVSLFSLYISTSVAHADNEFTVNADVTYEIQTNGKTLVTHDITLENNFSTLYATSYSLSLQNIETESVSSYSLDSSGAPQTLEVSSTKDGDNTLLKVSFTDAIVGKGSSRHFFISYENSAFAVKTGEIWEVSIPRLEENSTFRNYSIKLIVPPSFGLEAYMAPKPASFIENSSGKIYSFTRDQLEQGAITAGFGPFQVFSFNLAYHLENPLSVSSNAQIAIPPDTAYQKVYFENIDPKPTNVTIDPDGNWLATFHLSPRQRIDVKVIGTVQIFSGPRPFPIPSQTVLENNLKETEYWQINDSAIQTLARQLESPRAIYDYVSQNFIYDVDRVQVNVTRFGASEALKNPGKAICMEFTDTFIAIARAAGIPAREINGYAYTENPDIQPLGLVADVLHAWPEYYDRNNRVWVPIDPTWASTTGGENFFDKLDLRHFTFVIHGFDSTKPYAPGSYKLGPNPQKDVFVSFGKLPESRVGSAEIEVQSKKTIPFIGTYLNLIVKNTGPIAFYKLAPSVYFDQTLNQSEEIEVLPPYANVELRVKIPFSLLGKDTPDVVKVTADAAIIEIPTNKSSVVIISLVSLFSVFSLSIVALLLKLRKLRIDTFSVKIRTLYAKIFRKNPENQTPQNQ